MPISSNKHHAFIKLEKTEVNTEDHLKNLENLTSFFNNVRPPAFNFFGLIKEPTRIRAKNENGTITLEARTGSIFGIILKKFTEAFERSKSERLLAKKFIEDVINNYQENTDHDVMRYVNNIKIQLNQSDKEFSRNNLAIELNALFNKLNIETK